jgi:hypothetical protein
MEWTWRQADLSLPRICPYQQPVCGATNRKLLENSKICSCGALCEPQYRPRLFFHSKEILGRAQLQGRQKGTWFALWAWQMANGLMVHGAGERSYRPEKRVNKTHTPAPSLNIPKSEPCRLTFQFFVSILEPLASNPHTAAGCDIYGYGIDVNCPASDGCETSGLR